MSTIGFELLNISFQLKKIFKMIAVIAAAIGPSSSIIFKKCGSCANAVGAIFPPIPRATDDSYD